MYFKLIKFGTRVYKGSSYLKSITYEYIITNFIGI